MTNNHHRLSQLLRSQAQRQRRERLAMSPAKFAAYAQTPDGQLPDAPRVHALFNTIGNPRTHAAIREQLPEAA